MNHYRAPWGKLLIFTSLFATLLCVAAGFGGWWLHSLSLGLAPVLVSWLLPVLVFGCALFTVRGYVIIPDAILVRRLFWTTRLPRAGLKSASFEPGVMSKSLRTFGNGGFFSFTGWYWNKSLRSFRAYVTDLNRTVVLRYADRTVVISPDEPEEFVMQLTR